MPYATQRDRRTPPLELTKAPWPLAPLNVFLTGALDSASGGGVYDLRWDDPRELVLNSRFSLLGVNVYRSFDSEYGPFHRVTEYPLGCGYYRDRTDVEVVEEDVTDQFVLFGHPSTGSDSRRYVFRVRLPPIVVSGSQGVISHDPFDVWVTVDGVRVPVRSVTGFSGEVEIDPFWYANVGIQKFDPAVLPTATSTVTCVYRRVRTLLKTDLAQRVFYRVTAVGVPTNCAQGDCGPMDVVETPLEHATAVSNYEIEKLDWIWREAVRRNRFILEQGGERVKVFLRKNMGLPCPCIEEEFRNPRNDCKICHGVGIVGGYEGPFPTIIAPDDAERRIAQKDIGRTVEHTYEVWTGPSPLLSHRDFLVKLNGTRYSIGPVRFPSNRGMVLQQHFNIGLLDEQDVRYRVPLCDPTRYSILAFKPTGPEEGGPTPITEKGNIPDERELRGRTVAWENTTW